MQARSVISVGLTLGVLACTSEPTSVDMSIGQRVARAPSRSYTAVLLPSLGKPASQAADINSAGRVAGSWQREAGGEWTPVVWAKSVPTDLGRINYLDADYSIATASNTRGQVVGFSQLNTQETEEEAFLWADGVYTDLGVGIATDINSAGQVVGNSGSVALLWEKGVRTELWRGVATGINPAGQIVGASQEGHAILWHKGVMVDLGTLGGSLSQAEDINPAGQVVGWSFVPGDDAIHAFLWEKGAMKDLGTLGGANSFARAINPAGQIVGQSATETAGFRAFVWNKGVMSELDPLGEDYADAQGISPAGEIVGVTGIQPASNWTYRATMWTRKAPK